MPCLRPRSMLSGRLVLVQYRRMNLTTPIHCEMYQNAITCRCTAAPRVLHRLVPGSRRAADGRRTGSRGYHSRRDRPLDPSPDVIDPGHGQGRDPPRVGGSRRRRRAARPAGRQPAGRDRGRAPGEPGPRRPRDQSRDEARPPVPDGAAGDRHRARGGDRARRPRRSRRDARPRRPSRRPGFLNLRLADAALERMVGGHPRRARRLGPARVGEPARRSTSSSCRPTRPGRSMSATPAARSSATC